MYIEKKKGLKRSTVTAAAAEHDISIGYETNWNYSVS